MVSPSRNPKIGLLLGPAGLTFDGGNIHHVPVADPERTYPEHGPRCTAVAKTSAAGPTFPQGHVDKKRDRRRAVQESG